MKNTKKYILPLLLLFILIILIIIYYFYEKNDNKNEEFYDSSKSKDKGKVTFMFFLNKKELYNVLKNNHTFHNSLTPADLHARKVRSKEEYIIRIKDAVLDFDREDEDILRKCVGEARKYLQRLYKPWFNGKEADEIPWKFGLVNSLYEDGLPHTVGDVIILSKSYLKNVKNVKNVDNYDNYNSFINTLIHEKVHVYQKVKGYDEYLRHHQIERVKRRDESDRIRANPDIDEWMYKKDGRVYGAFYKNNTPSSITDVQLYENTQKSEHPLEEMAIVIADGYKGI
jgi:hypothetical protein